MNGKQCLTLFIAGVINSVMQICNATQSSQFDVKSYHFHINTAFFETTQKNVLNCNLKKLKTIVRFLSNKNDLNMKYLMQKWILSVFYAFLFDIYMIQLFFSNLS